MNNIDKYPVPVEFCPFFKILYAPPTPFGLQMDSIWITAIFHSCLCFSSLLSLQILTLLSEYPSCSTQMKSKRGKLFVYITNSSRIRIHLSERLDTVAKKLSPKPLFLLVFPVTTQLRKGVVFLPVHHGSRSLRPLRAGLQLHNVLPIGVTRGFCKDSTIGLCHLHVT